ASGLEVAGSEPAPVVRGHRRSGRAGEELVAVGGDLENSTGGRNHEDQRAHARSEESARGPPAAPRNRAVRLIPSGENEDQLPVLVRTGLKKRRGIRPQLDRAAQRRNIDRDLWPWVVSRLKGEGRLLPGERDVGGLPGGKAHRLLGETPVGAEAQPGFLEVQGHLLQAPS